MQAKPPILIFEDDHEDYEAVQRALQAAKVSNPIYRIVIGTDGMDYLHRRMGHQKRQSEPLPGLVLLDLALPDVDGLEVLVQIKSDPRFRHIPVVMFSSNENPSAIDACYRAGANGFVVKPIEREAFIEAVATVANYWLKISTPPRQEPTVAAVAARPY